jgi:hypothetical protein
MSKLGEVERDSVVRSWPHDVLTTTSSLAVTALAAAASEPAKAREASCVIMARSW